MRGRESEVALAERVTFWLRDLHWEVYQEVSCRGSRCDLVATQGPVTWAIEVKASFGLAVLEQAVFWKPHANRSSIAVPSATAFGQKLADTYGIGILQVGYDRITERLPARLQRRCDGRLRRALRDEQKTYAPAGNSWGAYFSPFKATCANLAKHVRENPGTTLKAAINAISHHYASPQSARSHLVKWIEAGKIPGIALRREGRVVLVDVAPEVSP